MQGVLFSHWGFIPTSGFLQMVLTGHPFLYITSSCPNCAMFWEVYIFDIDIDPVTNQIIDPHQFQPYSVDFIHLSYDGLYIQHNSKKSLAQAQSPLPPPHPSN